MGCDIYVGKTRRNFVISKQIRQLTEGEKEQRRESAITRRGCEETTECQFLFFGGDYGDALLRRDDGCKTGRTTESGLGYS